MTDATMPPEGLPHGREGTEAESQPRAVAASDIEVDREALDASIHEFAGQNGAYYAEAFHTIHEATGIVPRTFNIAAALLGPVWAAMRGVWGFFWAFLLLEIVAWVQIGRGAWATPAPRSPSGQEARPPAPRSSPNGPRPRAPPARTRHASRSWPTT